jgi:O-antigen/teichoic acid export membrane protein
LTSELLSAARLESRPSQSSQTKQRMSVGARSEGRSIGVNFAWASFGNIAFAAFQWGMLVILAKLGDADMVGKFALGLAITAPVIMFSNLHLQAVIRTDTRGEYQLGDYLGLRYVTSGLAILVIAVATIVIGYPRETAVVIFAIGLAKSVDSFSDIVKGFFQLHERMDRVAQSQILRGALWLVALGLLVALTGSILLAVLAMIVASISSLIGFDFRIAKRVARNSDTKYGESGAQVSRIRPNWDRNQLMKLAWLSLPLGIVALLTSLSMNAPRYVIERHLGEHELGIYAAMAYIMIAAMTLMQALGESCSPRLSSFHDRRDLMGFRSLLVKLIGFGAVCGLIGIAVSSVAGETMLRLMYTDEFAQQSNVLTLLSIAAMLDFIFVFLLYGLIAAQRFRSQVPTAIVTLAITLGGSFLLVPRFGLAGAAYAQMLAGAVGVVWLSALSVTVLRQLASPGAIPEAAHT